jgi:D-3-phosphoglycerate dehydrogenase / 2-oxoglutarate reductase
MRVAILLDDYLDTLRMLECIHKLDGHRVQVFTDHVQDADALAERLYGAEALVLIRERTEIRSELLDDPINVVNPEVLGHRRRARPTR